ncbi:hypothetical protein MACJ_000390 [Theileria orientalis]|uniref:Uncharacterized protein n=1 Tax=Theileria orientalis TaxID=68886 RepID=A0A976M3Z3_THEOR|nr:hypothetical protein MACJ_000390 [Theileria orientalis]
MSEQSPGNNTTACKLIAALVALSSHMIIHQIDVTSANFSIAFYIPLNNIAIYLTKLYSFRFILIVLGILTEFSISECSKAMHPGDHIRVRAEGYFFGLFHTSFIGIVPEHSLIVALSDDAYLCLVVTIAALAAWIVYHEAEVINSRYFEIKNVTKNVPRTMTFFRTLSHAFSPLMMIFVSSLIKDFLFPNLLPYALLSKFRWNFVTVMSSILKLIGPVLLFSLESNSLFPKWDTPYNAFWIIVVPMAVIYVYTFLAIHTRIPSAKSIINSVPKVMLITVGVVLGNSFFDPLSYAGVSKVVRPEKIPSGNSSPSEAPGPASQALATSSGEGPAAEDSDNSGEPDGDNAVITIHALSVVFMRFAISKLSAGYNDTRISLGYCFPRFRPNHRMSRSNLGWYIFRKTFKTAWKAVGNDFDMDIRNYL